MNPDGTVESTEDHNRNLKDMNLFQSKRRGQTRRRKCNSSFSKKMPAKVVVAELPVSILSQPPMEPMNFTLQHAQR